MQWEFGSTVIFHLSIKLWRARFFILGDVILLVRLQEKNWNWSVVFRALRPCHTMQHFLQLVSQPWRQHGGTSCRAHVTRCTSSHNVAESFMNVCFSCSFHRIIIVALHVAGNIASCDMVYNWMTKLDRSAVVLLTASVALPFRFRWQTSVPQCTRRRSPTLVLFGAIGH